jgi:hypothetical protein
MLRGAFLGPWPETVCPTEQMEYIQHVADRDGKISMSKETVRALAKILDRDYYCADSRATGMVMTVSASPARGFSAFVAIRPCHCPT